ncbi:hypothetical protein D3C84_1041280 [compost metagenome]
MELDGLSWMPGSVSDHSGWKGITRLLFSVTDCHSRPWGKRNVAGILKLKGNTGCRSVR